LACGHRVERAPISRQAFEPCRDGKIAFIGDIVGTAGHVINHTDRRA